MKRMIKATLVDSPRRIIIHTQPYPRTKVGKYFAWYESGGNGPEDRPLPHYAVPAILSKVMILPLSVLIYEYGHPNIERMIYFSKRTGEPSIWE